jgi:hypothetical protein
MKVGTRMDPFGRAYRFVPALGVVPLEPPKDPDDDDDDNENVITQEELEESTRYPVNREPEPDDPDAA